MSLALALALVFGAAGVAWLARALVAPHLRARCPGCQRRALVHRPIRDSLHVMYRCDACNARWVAVRGGLVGHEAFAAGARDPLPVARALRP